MMNILAIGLVLTSLITGTVWSPPPPAARDDGREVIVKEGHRVVVVEYEKEGDAGNTKVLISPHDPSGVDLEDTSVDAKGVFLGPRELVCDAYGKCKHKLVSAFGKTKEKVSDTVHGVSDKAHDVEEHAKDTVHGYEQQAKEVMSEAFGKCKQAAQEAGKMYEKVSDKAKGTEEKAKGHMVGEAISKAKESVAEGLGKAKKVAGDLVETARDSATKVKDFDVVDSPKRMGEDISRNVTRKVEEGAEQAKENVQKLGEKSMKEIPKKLKGLTHDVIRSVFSPSKLDAVVGLIHMLGFSTAYGMSIWVTFISSYILGRYLPREQFGMVQSRIYPVYFRATAYCVGAAFLAHLVSQKKMILSSMMEMFQGLNLLSALLMTLANMIYLEPKATKLMFERMKLEKEEGRGVAGAVRGGIPDCGSETVDGPPAAVVAERQDVLRLNDKLKKLNSYSSALNVSTLVALTWHMAYMGHRLKAPR